MYNFVLLYLLLMVDCEAVSTMLNPENAVFWG